MELNKHAITGDDIMQVVNYNSVNLVTQLLLPLLVLVTCSLMFVRVTSLYLLFIQISKCVFRFTVDRQTLFSNVSAVCVQQ